ncbi:hypothetical protein Tco_0460834 [Tanacetum coccineum]
MHLNTESCHPSLLNKPSLIELVPKENRFDIRKFNGRIPRGFSPREPTFQVTLDAIALTPCYPAFLITADVFEVYMHQFWNSVYKHDDFYRFKIDKKKRFKLTLEVFIDIFQICPRVQDQDFDALPIEEEILSFLRDLGHTGDITSLNYVVVNQMHQPWRTFAAVINKSLSGKTSGLDKLRIVFRETPVKTKSTRKEKVDVLRGKGINLLSEVALAEKSQLKEVRKKSLREFHKTHPIGSGKGAEVEMNKAQQGNENLETTQEQVVEDAHVTNSTVNKKTEKLFLHVHHEVLRTQAPTLLTIPVSVITESSPIYTKIPQSSQTFTPLPILTTPPPPPTIETTNPLSTLPDFALVF